MSSASLTTQSRHTGFRFLQALMWLVLAVVMLFPFYWALVTSFKPPPELTAFPPIFWPQQFSALENYRAVLEEMPMGRFFYNSLYVATISTLAVLFTSSLGGYIFEKFSFRGKEILFWES